jgi:hypothetical protein
VSEWEIADALADTVELIHRLEVILEKWEKSTRHPEVTLINIRNMKKLIEAHGWSYHQDVYEHRPNYELTQDETKKRNDVK